MLERTKQRREAFRMFRRRKGHIIRSYMAGKSAAEIGRDRDVSPSFVTNELKKWGVTLHKHGGRRAKSRKMQQIRGVIEDAKKRCPFCGQTDKRLLVFHHIDSATKIRSISSMARAVTQIKDLMAELAKCIAVCENCHAMLHKKEFFGIFGQ